MLPVEVGEFLVSLAQCNLFATIATRHFVSGHFLSGAVLVTFAPTALLDWCVLRLVSSRLATARLTTTAATSSRGALESEDVHLANILANNHTNSTQELVARIATPVKENSLSGI